MDSEIVANYVGPLSRYFLSKCPHHINPCNNLHTRAPSENVSDTISSPSFKLSPFSSSMPVPLPHLPELRREEINGIDSTTVLIREKIKWRSIKERIIKAVQKDKKNIRRSVIKKALKKDIREEAIVPQGVVLLAQHLDNDPDPTFSGVCNWYYTGGTMANIKHKDDFYLLHARHSDLNCSRIWEGCQSELCSTLCLEDEEPIYQIATNANGAAVRQKSVVSILSSDNSKGNGLKMRNIQSVFEKKNQFLSVAIPDGPLQQFCTISNVGVFKLWDIEYSKKYKLKILVQPEEGVSVSDNWVTLKYLDERTLLLADRCCLHVLDIRTDMREKQLAWCSKQLRDACEEQCSILCSDVSEHSIYTATTHQLLCLDLREGYNQRWTHMMASPPHLGFTQRMDDDCELVCLGSQILSDCVTVVNTWKDGQGQSLYKPTTVPSPAKGLHLARQHGECLDPSLTQRCTQSMTGLTFLPTHNGVHILRQSATGDVFIQELSASRKVTKELTEIDLMSYSQWSKPTLELPQDKILPVTCTYDFQSIVKDRDQDSHEQKKPQVAAEEGTQNAYFPWQMSKEFMENSVDLLAGKMLAVWQVEEEDEWAPGIEQRESFVEQDPEEKVINWLHTTDLSNDKTMPSTINPTVASTPYPPQNDKEKSPEPSENPSEPSPWMTKLSQKLRTTPIIPEKQMNTSFPPDFILSPPRSVDSTWSRRKRQKTLEDTGVTPTKSPLIAKRTNSAQKKKFIPGF